MRLFYIDGSQDGHFYTFSAISIHDSNWHEVMGLVMQFRRDLKAKHGIYLRKELHAYKFVSGRGRPSDRHLSLAVRASIFNECLAFLATLEGHGVYIINVALNDQSWAFERMLNRINRTMRAQHDIALLICDEGNEWEYTKLVRKMGVFNPIPSQYGKWNGTGKQTKNIPIDRIIEDPLFKQSHRSTLIQLADFCAFALLRKEKPHPARTALGLDKSFDLLEPVCFKAANPRDDLGVIR